MEQLKPTSLLDLQTYSQGKIVEFPEFDEGQPFVARVKRSSMMFLMQAGKIPNSLLAVAQGLFSGDSNIGNVESDEVTSMLSVVDIVVESCLIEPTVEQIKEAGMELTDQQKFAVFNYSQQGIKALEPFRKKQENSGNNINGKKL